MEKMTLKEAVSGILGRLLSLGYSEKTLNKIYEPYFNTLLKMAENLGKDYLDEDLKEMYLADTGKQYKRNEYCHARFLHHSRCIKFLESWIETGELDLSVSKKQISSAKSKSFADAAALFEAEMKNNNLAAKTICKNLRAVTYFNLYIEKHGYTSYSQVKPGDTMKFISWLCTERIQPTSSGTYLPGLRKFFKLITELAIFLPEIPKSTPKKKTLVEIYTDEEMVNIQDQDCLSNAPLRDKAIVTLSMNTGLRSVDIINLKLDDINWRNSTISIVQQKTKRRISIPLKASVGNSLVQYICYERPKSESRVLFLSTFAPHCPLKTSAAIWRIMRNAARNAGINEGRPAGTRIARHSHASALVRASVPLPLVSQALGHRSMDTTMIYITTDSKGMVECCLPLPSAGGGDDE